MAVLRVQAVSNGPSAGYMKPEKGLLKACEGPCVGQRLETRLTESKNEVRGLADIPTLWA